MLDALRAQATQRRLPLNEEEPSLPKRRCAFLEGFSLHANTRVHENDRDNLRRLCAYGARGPLKSRAPLVVTRWPPRLSMLFGGSGSFATCVGVACVLPATMPAQHPPTRFLHGLGDLTVPLYTAEAYQRRLTAEGFEADLIIDDAAGHEWLGVAPERILEWLRSH